MPRLLELAQFPLQSSPDKRSCDVGIPQRPDVEAPWGQDKLVVQRERLREDGEKRMMQRNKKATRIDQMLGLGRTAIYSQWLAQSGAGQARAMAQFGSNNCPRLARGKKMSGSLGRQLLFTNLLEWTACAGGATGPSLGVR